MTNDLILRTLLLLFGTLPLSAWAQDIAPIKQPKHNAPSFIIKGDTCILVGTSHLSNFQGNISWIDKNGNTFGDTISVKGTPQLGCDDGNGGYIIIGDFEYHYLNEKIKGILHVTKEGKVDPTFQNFNTFIPKDFSKIKNIQYHDSLLYFMGDDVELVENLSQKRLIQYSDSTRTIWDHLNFDGSIKSVAENEDFYYFGGDFKTVNGYSHNSLIRCSKDGNLDRNFSLPITGKIEDLKIKDSLLVLAGKFQNFGQNPSYNFAIYDLKNNTMLPSIHTLGNNNRFKSIEIIDSIIYLAGVVREYNPTDTTYYAFTSFNLKSLTPYKLGPIIKSTSGLVFDLESIHDTLFIAGSFTEIGHAKYTGLAAYNCTIDTIMPWDAEARGSVESIDVYKNNIYATGLFYRIGGLSYRVGAINTKTATTANLQFIKAESIYRLKNLIYIPQNGDFIFKSHTLKPISHDNLAMNELNDIHSFRTENSIFIFNNTTFGKYVNSFSSSIWALGKNGKTYTKAPFIQDSVHVSTNSYIFKQNKKLYITNTNRIIGLTNKQNTFQLTITNDKLTFDQDSFANVTFDNPISVQFDLVTDATENYIYTNRGIFNRKNETWSQLDTFVTFYLDSKPCQYLRSVVVRGGSKNELMDQMFFGDFNSYKVHSGGYTSKQRYIWTNTVNRNHGWLKGSVHHKRYIKTLIQPPPTPGEYNFIKNGSDIYWSRRKQDGYFGLANSYGPRPRSSYLLIDTGFRVNREIGGYLGVAGGKMIVHGFPISLKSSVAAFSLKSGKTFDINFHPNTSKYYYNKAAISGDNIVFSYKSPSSTRGLRVYNYILDTTYLWNPKYDGEINSMVLDNNRLFIGGWLKSFQGENRNNLLSVDLFNSKPTNWSPSFNNPINKIILKDSKVYVNGDFTLVEGKYDRERGVAVFDTTSIIPENTFKDLDGPIYPSGIKRKIFGMDRIGKDSIVFRYKNSSTNKHNLFYSLKTFDTLEAWGSIKGTKNLEGFQKIFDTGIGLGDNELLWCDENNNKIGKLPISFTNKFHYRGPTVLFSNKSHLMVGHAPLFNDYFNYGSQIFTKNYVSIKAIKSNDTLCLGNLTAKIYLSKSNTSTHIPLVYRFNDIEKSELYEVKIENKNPFIEINLDTNISPNSNYKLNFWLDQSNISPFTNLGKDTFSQNIFISTGVVKTPKITGPNKVCPGSMVDYKATSISNPTWQISGGIIKTKSKNKVSVIWNDSNSVKLIRLTNSNKSCKVSKIKRILMYPSPDFTFGFSDTFICFQDTINISTPITPYGNATWYSSTKNIIVSKDHISIPLKTKLPFYLHFKDSISSFKNCHFKSDSIKINILPYSKLSILADTTTCESQEYDYLISQNGILQDTVGKWTFSGKRTMYGIAHGKRFEWDTSGSLHFQRLNTTTNCIEKSDTLYINYNKNPTTEIIGTPSACIGDKLQFTCNPSSPATKANWFIDPDFLNPIGTQLYVNLEIKEMKSIKLKLLTKDSVSGCSSSIYDSIIISVNKPPEITILNNDTIYACLDHPIKLTAQTNVDSFYWKIYEQKLGANLTYTYTPSNTGMAELFFIAESENSACTSDKKISILGIEKPLAIIEESRISNFISKFNALNLRVFDTANWFVDDLFIQTGDSFTHEFDRNKTHEIQLNVNIGSCVSINKVDKNTSISLSNKFEKFMIYPNPATNSVTISMGKFLPNDSEMHIFNEIGQEIWKSNIKGELFNSITIPISNWSNGIYHITFLTQSGSIFTANFCISHK
mgnify:CR=1 FL=1